jgi:hypothetical protein
MSRRAATNSTPGSLDQLAGLAVLLLSRPDFVSGVPVSPAGDIERLAGAFDVGQGQAPAEDLCPGQIVGDG